MGMRSFPGLIACLLLLHSYTKLMEGNGENLQEAETAHKSPRTSLLHHHQHHPEGDATTTRHKSTKRPPPITDYGDFNKLKRGGGGVGGVKGVVAVAEEQEQTSGSIKTIKSRDKSEERKSREESSSTTTGSSTATTTTITGGGYCFGYAGPPGVPGVQGIQGVPGVQGVQGLPGVPGQHGRPGHRGEQGRRGHKGDKGEPGMIHIADQSSESSHVKVAFSVTMDEDVLKSTEYRVLHFNVVHTNFGDNYDPSTGVFTTPINGTYLLGMNIQFKAAEGINGVSYNSQHILLHLVRNGQRMFSAFDSSGCSGYTQPQQTAPSLRCSGSASNTGILALERGDKVWVELPDGYGLHNALYHNYASFYGHMLYPGATNRK